MASGFVTEPDLPESKLISFPPASDAARRAVKAAAGAPSRDVAAAQMLAEEISPERVAEAVASEEESANVPAPSGTATAGPWAGRYTFPEQDERTVQILVRASPAQHAPQSSGHKFWSTNMGSAQPDVSCRVCSLQELPPAAGLRDVQMMIDNSNAKVRESLPGSVFAHVVYD